MTDGPEQRCPISGKYCQKNCTIACYGLADLWDEKKAKSEYKTKEK